MDTLHTMVEIIDLLYGRSELGPAWDLPELLPQLVIAALHPLRHIMSFMSI